MLERRKPAADFSVPASGPDSAQRDFRGLQEGRGKGVGFLSGRHSSNGFGLRKFKPKELCEWPMLKKVLAKRLRDIQRIDICGLAFFSL
jgi:hypothetical protein